MISTSRKIHAILLNIKINQQQLVSMCGYKLATNWRQISRKYILSLSENIAKCYREATFLTHTVDKIGANSGDGAYTKRSPLLWQACWKLPGDVTWGTKMQEKRQRLPRTLAPAQPGLTFSKLKNRRMSRGRAMASPAGDEEMCSHRQSERRRGARAATDRQASPGEYSAHLRHCCLPSTLRQRRRRRQPQPDEDFHFRFRFWDLTVELDVTRWGRRRTTTGCWRCEWV